MSNLDLTLPTTVSWELIHTIEQALNNHDYAQVEHLLLPLHPADLADVIEALSASHKYLLINALKDKLNPEVLAELDEYTRDLIIDHLTPQEVAAALTDLDSDDAVQIIGDLDDQQQQKILKAISYEERATLREGLRHPEHTAGRLMQQEYVSVQAHLSVKNIHTYLKKHPDLPDRFFDIFIVDETNHFKSTLPLSEIMRHDDGVILQDIMPTDAISIPEAMGQSQIAYLFQRYGLTSLAVVNDDQKLVGMITVDDAVTVMHQEAAENLMNLGRVVEGDFHAPVWQISINRFRWLFITFINTLIASCVLYTFQDTLQNHIALAVLLPIVASMGGNAGMQVVTVIIRAISDRDIKLMNVPRVLGREVAVSLVNATLFALILSSIATVWYNDLILGVILGIAMVFNMVWSAIAGTIFPLTLHQLRLDPAISAGPILTTTTDVLGFSVFLGLARFFL